MSFRQIILILIAQLCLAGAALAEKKVALIVGNSDYRAVQRLQNGSRDAEDVARALERLGFDVTLGLDLSRNDMLRLVQDVKNSLNREDLALFYYAGHAIQIGSENYMLPVDADGRSSAEVAEQSVSLQSVLAGFERNANRNIFILDACRDNPIESDQTTRSTGAVTRGLARVTASVGSFIAFSTEPQNVALDGNGRNSPFAAALLRQLQAPEDDIHAIMREVRREVVEETNGAQVPWENSSLIERVYLGERPGPVVVNRPDPVETRPLENRAVPAFPYRVAGTDPTGDAFLALRSAASPQGRLLQRMPEGTRLDVLDQKGVWFNVRTETGQVGWAHSNWIRFEGARAIAPETCESLWLKRNEIFARNGYCFQSPRGQRAFSNDGCLVGVPAGSIPLTSAEKREVQRLLGQEQSMNCR